MGGVISAPQPLAVEEGAKVLANGGNAFDAALTAAAVQFLIDPHSCGIGGYLVMTGMTADGRQQIVDAPALAGERTSPKMWEDIVIGPNPDGWGFFLEGKVNEDGYQSICIPSMVRGMESIHKLHCTRSWREILSPAIRIANEGWTVMAHMANRWKDPPQFYESSSLRQKLDVSKETQRIYLKDDGQPRDIGEILRNPDYGASLQTLADEGPDSFYTGSLSKKINDDLESNQAWVTRQDLSEYRSRLEQPVVVNYRGYQIVTNQLPHGGPSLAQMFRILERFEPTQYAHNGPEYILLLARVMKAAFADRNQYHADPDHQDVPLDWLLSDERTQYWHDQVAAGANINVGRMQTESPDTTHVSVLDDQGNCASLTHSLGSSSGVITPGWGFMYNNSMVNFYPYSGHANSILPGKGRTTGMTPTLVLKDGKPVLVIGAPGATRIITSTLQVIVNHLDWKMPISEAVVAARMDCQADIIKCHARIPEFVCEEIRKQHECQRLARSHGGFALVHAVAQDPRTGALSGGADTGSDGMAVTV